MDLRLQISTLRSMMARDRMTRLACSQMGVQEFPGPEHNPEVLKFFAASGHAITNDETAWCAAFMNWLCAQMEIPMAGTLAARDWLDVGHAVAGLEHAVPFQDAVVFWRVDPAGWQGHVGLYVNHGLDTVQVLGGNQGNRVSVAPYARERLLGVRRLF